MPRAGLDAAAVVAGAARLADEIGLANVTMGLLAERLGVRTPSLYKHVAGQADLNRRIAVLALTELGDALTHALRGRSGKEALSAAARTIRSFVLERPGRYAATVRIDAEGPDDPLAAAGTRVIDSLSVVPAGYGIAPDDTI
ncbi:MAG: TetR family transcriptional regulator, partial [Nocardioides sp.]|nr:TetR family transcriptional regulator [Nocardioides sp.]